MHLEKEIVRAGRALLGWTQQQLADESGLAIGTIARLESSGTYDDNMTRIFRAMEKGGISFITQHGEVIGVKKTKERRYGRPRKKDTAATP